MKRVLMLACLVSLLACTHQAFKPPRLSRIHAHYTNSGTVEIKGSRGAVPGAATVTILDEDSVTAVIIFAEDDGSFWASFFDGEWARSQGGPYDYKKPLAAGDTLTLGFTICGFASKPVTIVIK